MFYLIDDKDGITLPDDYMLVNINLLQMLEVNMEKGGKSLGIEFYFSESSKDSEVFTINKDGDFNTNQIMKNLSQAIPQKYDKNFILLQDSHNINCLQNNQFYLHKFSNILIKLDNIFLIYTNNDKENIIVTAQKRFSIEETPQQVFDIIQSRVIA